MEFFSCTKTDTVFICFRFLLSIFHRNFIRPKAIEWRRLHKTQLCVDVLCWIRQVIYLKVPSDIPMSISPPTSTCLPDDFTLSYWVFHHVCLVLFLVAMQLPTTWPVRKNKKNKTNKQTKKTRAHSLNSLAFIRSQFDHFALLGD